MLIKKYYHLTFFFLVTFALAACAPKYAENDLCDGDSSSPMKIADSGCPLPGMAYDTIEDFMDNGQFDYKQTFFGYWMVGINAKYKECPSYDSGCIRNITIKLHKGKGLSNEYDHKMATVNNIKNDLIKVCGEKWESLRSTQKFPQTSSGGFWSCDMEDNLKNKTYDIFFYDWVKR
jgi:hypothetical protein